MQEETRLKRSDVRNILEACYPDYKGRKIRLKVTSSFHPSPTYWSGGTKSDYVGFNLRTGEAAPLPAQFHNPREFGGSELPSDVNVPEGILVVEHRIFCGHDSGITIFCHPHTMWPSLTKRASQ